VTLAELVVNETVRTPGYIVPYGARLSASWPVVAGHVSNIAPPSDASSGGRRIRDHRPSKRGRKHVYDGVVGDDHDDVATAKAAVPSMGYLVWHLSLRWQARFSDELEPLGITPAEYAILAHLHALSASGVEPHQRQLADVSGLEPMYVSKLARSLEGVRLLTRAPHPEDPRAIQLSLTRRGAGVVTEARRIATRLDRQRLASLGGATSERAAQLKASLQLLLRDADDARRQAASTPAQRASRKEIYP
jgi:DNA-binding MarR family transcriptional regulator